MGEYQFEEQKRTSDYDFRDEHTLHEEFAPCNSPRCFLEVCYNPEHILPFGKDLDVMFGATA